jgi:hypothetical protein
VRSRAECSKSSRRGKPARCRSGPSPRSANRSAPASAPCARRLSQELLGRRAGLSGKFIGEVERGEKSISVDNLYRVSLVLGVGLHRMVDLPSKPLPSPYAEQIVAFVITHHAAAVRRVRAVLQSVLGAARSEHR